MQNANTSTGNLRREGIARRLEATRRRFGLNQTAFAERLGFARRTYLSWERGDSEPPVTLLEALRSEFGVDPFWLLQGPGDLVVSYGAGIDWARMHRLHTEIAEMMRDLRLAPSPAQSSELVRGVFELLPDEEEVAMQRLRSTLGAMGSHND